jgi:hypothetical protein
MPDPNLPTLGDYLAMTPAPQAPQPYQERFLAALEDGSRLETWQERWDRKRNERFIQGLKESLLVIGRNTNGITGSLSFLARQYRHQPPAWRLMAWPASPTIGRKRRARRARGRRRGNT